MPAGLRSTCRRCGLPFAGCATKAQRLRRRSWHGSCGAEAAHEPGPVHQLRCAVTDSEPHNLEQLLERLGGAGEGEETVALGTLLDVTGRRSFGPLLLLTGLVPLSPLSGIPGLPSVMAVCVLLISAQLLMGRDCFWLPEWVLKREISRQRFDKALRFLNPVARFIDRFIHPRLQRLTRGRAVYGLAIVATAVALLMFPLELVPFANTLCGAAITVFGLALIAHDGLLVLLGYAAAGGAAAATLMTVM